MRMGASNANQATFTPIMLMNNRNGLGGQRLLRF
jgi:hypothetical protein